MDLFNNLAIGFGVANIAPLDVLAIIGKSIFGLPVGSDITAGATSIVMEIWMCW